MTHIDDCAQCGHPKSDHALQPEYPTCKACETKALHRAELEKARHYHVDPRQARLFR